MRTESVQDFVAHVRGILDEEGLLTGVQYESEESVPVERRIRQLAVGAVNEVRRLLPWHKVAGTAFVPEIHEEGQTGDFAVPSDYLRLHTLKMQGWHKSVHNVISESDDEYAYQLVEATRGGVYNPVVARVDDGRRLRYFSVNRGEDHKVETALYIPELTKLGDFLTGTQDEITAAELLTARDVALSFGRDVKGLTERVKESIGV